MTIIFHRRDDPDNPATGSVVVNANAAVVTFDADRATWVVDNVRYLDPGGKLYFTTPETTISPLPVFRMYNDPTNIAAGTVVVHPAVRTMAYRHDVGNWVINGVEYPDRDKTQYVLDPHQDFPRPIVPIRDITVGEFVTLFDPITETPAIATSDIPAIKTQWTLITTKIVQTIDTKSPRLLGVLQLFAANGLIQPERVDEIYGQAMAIAASPFVSVT